MPLPKVTLLMSAGVWLQAMLCLAPQAPGVSYSPSQVLWRESVPMPLPSAPEESLCAVAGMQHLFSSLKRGPCLLLPFGEAERGLCAPLHQ